MLSRLPSPPQKQITSALPGGGYRLIVLPIAIGVVFVAGRLQSRKGEKN
jgi:hypothetical protein